jgi:hypothetical protein
MCRSNNSRVWRLRCLHGVFAASMFLTACQRLGPWAIEEGRERYNEKIHITSRDQLFANIMRVYYDENPLFMDVSEVDAAELIQGVASGGVAGIGGLSALQGAGQLEPTSGTAGMLKSSVVSTRAGAASGSFEYQESPTIRYFPLSGQALVAQIVTPISVTSLANLYPSDWPFLSLLDLAIDRATPNYIDTFAAINAIVSLEYYGALVVTATKSDATRPETPKPQRIDGTNFTIQTTPPSEQAVDSLTLYLQPDHPALPLNQPKAERTFCDGAQYKSTDITPTDQLSLAKRNIMHFWIRLLQIYLGTQSDDLLKKYKNNLQDARTYLRKLDDRVGSLESAALDTEFNQLPKKIELRSSAVPTMKQETVQSKRSSRSVSVQNVSPPNKAPVIQTHSALGILINLKVNTTVEFVTPDTYKLIREELWNRGDEFYTLLGDDLSAPGFSRTLKIPDPQILSCVSSWIANTPEIVHYSFSVMEDVTDYRAVEAEYVLGHLRRYILIIVSDSAPTDAFVSYTRRGKTFYIDGADKISQWNFGLISQFMTMQAVAPTTAPLTPTISVGAGG